jgi:hypothetical protein
LAEEKTVTWSRIVDVEFLEGSCMATRRATPGALQRQEWGKKWRERVPQEELLALGQMYRFAIRLLRHGEGPAHDPRADWERLYRLPSSDVSRQALAAITHTTVSLEHSDRFFEDEAALDDWLRDVFHITPLNRRESISKGALEVLSKNLTRSLPKFRLELRATLDHVAALALFRCPLALLLARAEQGDADALESILRINSALESRPWVRERLAGAVKLGGVQAARGFSAAISRGLGVRENKLLEVGALLLLLWPWLRRLSASQQRGFLKSLGVPPVPGKEALREYERWLGVKGLHREWMQTSEVKSRSVKA